MTFEEKGKWEAFQWWLTEHFSAFLALVATVTTTLMAVAYKLIWRRKK